MLRKNYGCVRVDFNQPFSLKVAKCSLNVRLTGDCGSNTLGVAFILTSLPISTPPLEVQRVKSGLISHIYVGVSLIYCPYIN